MYHAKNLKSDDHCGLNYSPFRYKSCCSLFLIQGEIEILGFPLTNTSVGVCITFGYTKPANSIMYSLSLMLHTQTQSGELKY